ncbi:MAG: carboxypeptidase-like regulatory domain-containing protein [Acidimicrobiales bacterium]
MSRLVVALAAALVLVACTGSDEDAAPPRPVEITEPAPLVDRSGIVLAPVGGSTTSTIVDQGTARVVGTVRGPTGPVPGATVRIERIGAGGQQGTDVLTDADGRFELAGAPGGRYRVRAFLAPALAQTVAEVRFLADAQEHAFDLVVEDRRGLAVRADAAPEPPVAGQPVNVVVLVASIVVDGDGVVRHQPVGGRLVELVGLGRWELREVPPAETTSTTVEESFPPSTVPALPSSSVRTDSAGRARFELVCGTAGPAGLALRVPVTVAPPAVTTTTPSATSTTVTPLTTTETVALELPDCVAPGAPPTTAATSSEP